MKHGIWGRSITVDLYEYYRDIDSIDEEYDVCSHFGCGRKLIPQEKLFGDRCQSHQKKEKIIDLINKIISL